MIPKVITKRSTTAGVVPLATDLSVGELAINTADQSLYSKGVDGVVFEISRKSTNSLSTGLSTTNSTVISLSTSSSTAVSSLSTAIGGLSPGGVSSYLICADEKAAGTHGGTSTNATWHTRTLNTVAYNSITGASLSSNRITLPSGVYLVTAGAPAYQGNRHRLRLQNITDGITALVGQNAFSWADNSTTAHLYGRLVLTGNKVFELQHYITTGVTLYGLGANANDGLVEKYTEIRIEKIA